MGMASGYRYIYILPLADHVLQAGVSSKVVAVVVAAVVAAVVAGDRAGVVVAAIVLDAAVVLRAVVEVIGEQRQRK